MHLPIGDLIEEGGAFADLEARHSERLRAIVDEYGRWRDGAEELAHNAGVSRDEVFRAMDAAATLSRHGEPEEAERRFRELLTPGGEEPAQLVPLAVFQDEPEPPPVLWQADPDPSHRFANPVLSAGEVAVLSGPGGLGKSTLTLALAVEAAAPTSGLAPRCW